MSSSQYTAFISYRHQTPDQEIAKKLHQMIETYTVPAALRKDGARHPGKVFRDQEELPLSADLGRDIEAALDNSDWLICICSPRYLQSRWCLRELEYFIEHKGRDRVLAVLVEGEPEDSFPELLRFETDENGNRKEREPLAANVRGESLAENLKKLKKEKFRILAPIVGTSFDGLYQRARRRTMRNILAAALATVAILGGFLAYALVQNGKITAQNEQITAQNERISAQNDELTEKNEQIEKANQDLTKANDEITAKNKEISEKNDELTEKNEQIEKANQELTEKNEQIEKANEDLSRANDEITAKNKEISEKNDELTEKNEQIEKANQDLTKANDEITAKNKEISEKNDELTEKNEQIEKANQDLTKANDEITAKNKEISEKNDELTEKNEQIEKANQDLTEANAQITAQNQEISEKNIRIEEERATAARNECDLLTEKSVYYSSINRKNEATKLALNALEVSETVEGYGKNEGMEALAVSCYMGDFAVDAVLDFPGFVNYDPSCFFSPDGKKIAVVDSRSGLSLCDAVTGDRLWVSTPFSHDIDSVHWNADSTKLVVTVMWGHMVCIIDAATGEHLQELYKVFMWPCNAIFEGDNILVAFSNGIVRFEPDSQDGVFPWPVQIEENQHVTSRSFLNDRYISICEPGLGTPSRIFIKGLNTDEYFGMVMDNNKEVTGYTLSPDAEWIYVHLYNEAMVINMRTDEIRWRTARDVPASNIGLEGCSPVWVGDVILDCGNAYDAMTGEVRYTTKNDCVCVSPDGQFFTDASGIYRLSDGKGIADVPNNGNIRAMSPDGSRLIVFQPTVYGRGLPNNEDAIAARRQAAYVELFPGNGSQYTVDQYEGSMLEISDYTEPDLPAGTIIPLNDPYGTSTTSYLASRSFISPDCRYILMMNRGAYIPLYDLEAGYEPIARIYDFSVGDHVEAKDISFSADSRFMAIAGAEGHVAVYELANGRMVFSYTDTYLARSLSEIRFNATGNYIMVADFNRTRFRVYSVTNGQTVYNMNAMKEIRDWGFDLETGDAVMWYTDGSAQIFRMFENEDDLLAFAREKAAE